MKQRYYLAYGSNLNVKQMKTRCPTAVPVGSAILEGYALQFRGGIGMAVATIEPVAGCVVPCVLWLITPRDEVSLDIYEGYPRLYRKEMVSVRFGKRRMRVMVYVMNDGYDIALPSPVYLRTIADGYGDFGLDLVALKAAVEVSLHARTRQVYDVNREM